MASTGKTANLGLNQWARTDGVCMDDFNADNALLDAAVALKPNIASGTYTGTGTYGTANKNTLTFSFAPRAVLIYTADGQFGVLFQGNATGFLQGGVNYEEDGYSNGTERHCIEHLTWSSGGKTLSWYNPVANYYQYNESGVVYHWIALG